MSFWSTTDNSQPLVNQDGSFDSNPDIEVIPKGTYVQAIVTEAAWKANDGEYADSNNGSRFINLRWDIIEGEYKKRVVFQKIWVEALDDKKRDKAVRMLAAIDHNCGGALFKAGQEPTDMAMMQHLCNKPQILQLDVWNKKEDGKDVPGGNWVRAVYSKGAAPAQKTAAPAQQASQDLGFDEELDF